MKLHEMNVEIEEVGGGQLVTWIGPVTGEPQAALFLGRPAKSRANALFWRDELYEVEVRSREVLEVIEAQEARDAAQRFIDGNKATGAAPSGTGSSTGGTLGSGGGLGKGWSRDC